MANLKQLKSKRQSVIKTRKVTRAMEAVSAVKMQKSQELALKGRKFALVALNILRAMSGDKENMRHFLVRIPKTGKHGLLLITSDKGLAGSLNSAVLKKTSEFIDKYGSGHIEAFAVGRRANDFLQARNIKVIGYIENKKDEISMEEVKEISDVIINEHKSGTTKTWHMAYMNFVSTFEQNPVFRQIMPLSGAELSALVKDMDSKGTLDMPNPSETKNYITESFNENLADILMPQMINIAIHHALWESKASEHSARMVAMKSATDKAGEMSHELLLKFNKARQAAITREVSEITSGVEAMK